ncbi:GAF domain-containing protein [Streptomyces daqingensis]|uniref:GAF domain-containing protein n=1 Tax=Streptomyces daqingensis TaxID=1472640 RepID=A0ABQ2LXU5_9ACTN|nr:GAF and ANTAR domain-containing protein [Streptomyces daqingensis]GGO44458.1 GAF domain-containing protein [Streptomyces daqingensis]
MNEDRRARLWNLVVEHAGGKTTTVGHVCAAAISAAGVDAAAVTVVLDASPRETVHASAQLAADMSELTVTLGEGPDAVLDSPCLVADLEAAEHQRRWPVYGPAAGAAGVRAVFAFPLRAGGVAVGVMCLYRAEPGNLNRDQLSDALVLADIVLALLLDTGRDLQPSLDGRWSEQTGPWHPEVHQATGMLTVQLGVTAAVALVRLRAYAFSQDRRLSEVAKDVVARRLRIDGSEPTP